MAPGQPVLQQPWNLQFNHAEHPRPDFPPPYTDLEFSNHGYISDNYDVITTSHPQQHDAAPSHHVQQQSWNVQNHQPDIAALEHVQEQSWNMQIDQSDIEPLHVVQQQPCNMEQPQVSYKYKLHSKWQNISFLSSPRFFFWTANDHSPKVKDII